MRKSLSPWAAQLAATHSAASGVPVRTQHEPLIKLPLAEQSLSCPLAYPKNATQMVRHRRGKLGRYRDRLLSLPLGK